jgi:hypothetical protein
MLLVFGLAGDIEVPESRLGRSKAMWWISVGCCWTWKGARRGRPCGEGGAWVLLDHGRRRVEVVPEVIVSLNPFDNCASRVVSSWLMGRPA